MFTPYSRLLFSTAFVVVSHVGWLGVSGVIVVLVTINILGFKRKSPGAPVVKWVKRWPTDLADGVRSPLEAKSSKP